MKELSDYEKRALLSAYRAYRETERQLGRDQHIGLLSAMCEGLVSAGVSLETVTAVVGHKARFIHSLRTLCARRRIKVQEHDAYWDMRYRVYAHM